MAVQVLPDRDANGHVIQYFSPHALKSGVDGKYFKRIHGVNNTINAGGTGNLEFVIPYENAKISKLEIFGCDLKDIANVKFYDTPTGTISATLEATGYTAIPNLLLNQFGFSAEMPPGGIYVNKSQYDADVIKDMKISVEYTNNGASAKYIGLNVHLDEVKPL